MRKLFLMVFFMMVMMLAIVSSAFAFTPAGLLQGETGTYKNSSDVTLQASVTEWTDNNNSTYLAIAGGSNNAEFILDTPATLTSLRILMTGTTSDISIQFYDELGAFLDYPDSAFLYVEDINGTEVIFDAIPDVKRIHIYNTASTSMSLYEFDVYSTSSDTTAPATPLDLNAIAGDTQVTLSWDANTDLDLAGYNIYRDGIKINTGLVTDETYVDTGLTNGVEYTYTITAVDTSDNESVESNEALATPFAALADGRALIVITLDNGLEKEYDWSMDEVNDFLDWYDDRAEGIGSARYVVEKEYNKGPFLTRKEYLLFNKIITFEVMEYEVEEE